MLIQLNTGVILCNLILEYFKTPALSPYSIGQFEIPTYIAT